MADQTYVVVAVAATFLAVLLASTTFSVRARSRRATEVLQGQLESAGVPVAHPQGAASFSERVIEPAIARFSAMAGRITPSGLRSGVERRLVLAGNPKGWTAETFLAAQIVLTAAASFGGHAFGMRGDPHVLGPLWLPVMAFAGYTLAASTLDRKARGRQDAIRRMLADTIDLLTISVEAGLSFDAALLHARRTVKGPLSEEIGRMLHEIQLGVRRPDAMRNLSERTDVQELKSFVLAMVQADVFGVSIANVLRSQSQELRTKRRQYAEERAMKMPVKLLLPMIGCILPSLLVLVVGPGIIRVSEGLF